MIMADILCRASSLKRRWARRKTSSDSLLLHPARELQPPLGRDVKAVLTHVAALPGAPGGGGCNHSLQLGVQVS